MSRKYGTNLSPRDYHDINHVDYGIGNTLAENYVKRIAHYHKVDYFKLASVYSTIYGGNWVNISYAKLKQIAKAMPRLASIRDGYYTPKPVSPSSLVKYRTQYVRLSDTYAYRRAVRVFGKKRIMECYQDNNASRAHELAKAILGYRIVQEIDGQAMANLMKKQIPTLANIYATYNDYTKTYRCKNVLSILPDNIADDIRKLAKQNAVLSCDRCHSYSSYTSVTSCMLRKINGKADSVLYIRKHDGNMLEVASDKLSQAVSEMYTMLELDKALATIGLEIDKHRTYRETEPRRYSVTKIDPKLIRAVKAVLNTSYSDAAKRDMIEDIVGKMLRERNRSARNRTYWLPLLSIKSEERN